MKFTLKTATLNTSNMDINDLHITLNNIIKNKMYNIKPQKCIMDNPDDSTCADTLDLNHDFDLLDNLGVFFFKNIEFKHKNKLYNINVFNVVDLDLFINNSLRTGWILTTDYKFSCYCLDIPPGTWFVLNAILTT